MASADPILLSRPKRRGPFYLPCGSCRRSGLAGTFSVVEQPVEVVATCGEGGVCFLAEVRGARRVVAVDNEQYVEWVRARFGVNLPAGAGFRAIAELLASRVEYHRMDALDVRELDERFDVAMCLGILHRVTDPIALLQALADVLTPGGEIVLETYGSQLPGHTPAIEVHQPGDVYPRDDFVYWSFPVEGLRRLARIAGVGDVQIVDQPEIDGHPRIVAVLRAARRPQIQAPTLSRWTPLGGVSSFRAGLPAGAPAASSAPTRITSDYPSWPASADCASDAGWQDAGPRGGALGRDPGCSVT